MNREGLREVLRQSAVYFGLAEAPAEPAPAFETHEVEALRAEVRELREEVERLRLEVRLTRPGSDAT